MASERTIRIQGWGSILFLFLLPWWVGLIVIVKAILGAVL